MNYKLKSSSYLVGKDIIRFRRTKVITQNQQESKSLANVKNNMSPDVQVKKQKTIHNQENQEPQLIRQSCQANKGRLFELLSMRKNSLTPLLKQQIVRPQTLIKNQPDFNKEQDLYQRIRRQSIECPQTQEKQQNFQLKNQQESTQKREIRIHHKSVNNINATPQINKSVSQFTCLTPRKRENNYYKDQQQERIKKQKLEGLINLFVNSNIENTVIAFNELKKQAPLLPFIKDLEQRKTDFRQKIFAIQLVKAK